jgi:hypothetical protein
VENDDTDPDGLNPAEEAFVDACASGRGLKNGASAAGISYRSAKRWHKKAHIAAAIRARCSENLSQARATLAAGANAAAGALVSMADGSVVADAPRVTSARGVLEHATKLVELEDIHQELAEIKVQLATMPGGHRRGRM